MLWHNYFYPFAMVAVLRNCIIKFLHEIKNVPSRILYIKETGKYTRFHDDQYISNESLILSTKIYNLPALKRFFAFHVLLLIFFSIFVMVSFEIAPLEIWSGTYFYLRKSLNYMRPVSIFSFVLLGMSTSAVTRCFYFSYSAATSMRYRCWFQLPTRTGSEAAAFCCQFFWPAPVFNWFCATYVYNELPYTLLIKLPLGYQ